MSAHKQGDEVPSAGAAAAPAPTAGDGQESKQHALEVKMRELKEKIEKLETKILLDEVDVKCMYSEAERVEARRAVTEDKKQRNLLEARRDRLEAQIEQLLAPAEQPTAAGGRSPTLCLPLRSHIGLPCRVLRALLLLREFDSPFYLCARTATRPTRRFARVVRSSSVHVHHPSMCIDGVALSLPHRLRAASYLVHAPRGAADSV
jgi:chorismate mutase